MEELVDDPAVLRKIIQELEEELDQKNQETFNLKNEISLISNVMIPAVLEEIEQTQIDKEHELVELTKKIKEETVILNTLNDERAEKVEDLDKLIESLTCEKAKLECDLRTQMKRKEEKILDKSTRESGNEQCLLEEVRSEISVLEEENYNLNSTIKELKDILDSKTLKCSSLMDEIEVVENKRKCSAAQAKAYKMCIDVLKNQPLDPSKQGNSMFAEVADSCQKVKENILKLEKQSSMYKNKLISQSADAKSHLAEIEKLVMDMEMMKDCVNVDNIVINSFEEEIMELNKAIENYYDSMMRVIPVDPNELDDPSDAAHIMNVMEIKWSDIVKPLKHLQKMIKDHFNTAQDLIKKNFVLRNLRRTSLKLSVESKKSKEISCNLSVTNYESPLSEKHLSPADSSLDLEVLCKSDRAMTYYKLTPNSPSFLN